MSKTVLIVDDEPAIRDVVSMFLTSHGFTVTEAADGADAVAAVKTQPELDLIILDVMMPGMNGIEALKQIRTFSNVPALFLTAKTQERDKAEAYESGGDDYLSKPFSQGELLMKVNSLVRRYREYNSSRESADSTAVLKDLEIDTAKRTVFKNGTEIQLTDTEYELFIFFLEHRGVPNDAKSIYESVWGEKYLPSAANTVMVHVLNLRRKIEDDPTQPEIIKTVWGKGYQID